MSLLVFVGEVCIGPTNDVNRGLQAGYTYALNQGRIKAEKIEVRRDGVCVGSMYTR